MEFMAWPKEERKQEDIFSCRLSNQYSQMYAQTTSIAIPAGDETAPVLAPRGEGLAALDVGEG